MVNKSKERRHASAHARNLRVQSYDFFTTIVGIHLVLHVHCMYSFLVYMLKNKAKKCSRRLPMQQQIILVSVAQATREAKSAPAKA